MDIEALKKRIDDLIDLAPKARNQGYLPEQTEVFNGAITIFPAIYGSDSHQVSTLLSLHKTITNLKDGRLENNFRALTSSAEVAPVGWTEYSYS